MHIYIYISTNIRIHDLYIYIHNIFINFNGIYPFYFSTSLPMLHGLPDFSRMLRMCLMIYLVEVMGGAWLVEQPSQSLLRFHPRVMWTFSIFRATRPILVRRGRTS